MLNRLISKLIAFTFLVFERFIEVAFLYDRKKSISERFIEKRKNKIYVLKLLWNEIQIFFIINWRYFRTSWTDHIWPYRFYRFCWEDFKWVVVILSFLKVPKYVLYCYFAWVYNTKALYTNVKFGRETYPWTIWYLYYWSGKDHFRHLFFYRDSICTNKILKYIYVYYLYNLTNHWVYTSYVKLYLDRLKFKGLDNYVEYNKFSWYYRKLFYYVFVYFSDHYYFVKLKKLKIGLYERNTNLVVSSELNRNYWLIHNLKDIDEKPDNLIIKEKPDIVKKKIKQKQEEFKIKTDLYWKEVEKKNKFNWYKITENIVKFLKALIYYIKKVLNFMWKCFLKVW